MLRQISSPSDVLYRNWRCPSPISTIACVDNERKNLIDLWRSVNYLPGVSEHALGELARHSALLAYEQGAIIFLQDDPVSGLFLVESGAVKICRHSKEGREHILQITYPGDTFNDVAALDGAANPATAVAFTATRLWRITRDDLRAVTQRHPDLAWALIESLARRARFLVASVQNLAMRDVRGRLARLLLEQAEAAESGEEPVPLTQEEMANRVGTVREVVGRTLRALAADNIISMERQHIVVVDRERLAREADI
jgi:CRP/FNR family cyclic AMP-dependent transcriptional regulator